MTVLVFLNEPEEGGETAFPFANNNTFNKEVFITNYFESRN